MLQLAYLHVRQQFGIHLIDEGVTAHVLQLLSICFVCVHPILKSHALMCLLGRCRSHDLDGFGFRLLLLNGFWLVLRLTVDESTLLVFIELSEDREAVLCECVPCDLRKVLLIEAFFCVIAPSTALQTKSHHTLLLCLDVIV